jgi:hypothetical protein
MGRPAGADGEIPDAPGGIGAETPDPGQIEISVYIPDSPIPGQIGISDFPIPRIIPGQIGNRPRPGGRNPGKLADPGQIGNQIRENVLNLIFFAAARTVPVTAHCALPAAGHG